MSPEAILKTVETRFKKGNIPHNSYNEIGKIVKRADSYLWICTALGIWEQLHRVIWEQRHGKIPNGYCLRFKDGDTGNCKIDNLLLIPRSENLQHNNMGDSAIASRMSLKRGEKGKIDYALREVILEHPELIELKRQQLLLQREIKTLKNEQKSHS